MYFVNKHINKSKRVFVQLFYLPNRYRAVHRWYESSNSKSSVSF